MCFCLCGQVLLVARALPPCGWTHVPRQAAHSRRPGRHPSDPVARRPSERAPRPPSHPRLTLRFTYLYRRVTRPATYFTIYFVPYIKDAMVVVLINELSCSHKNPEGPHASRGLFSAILSLRVAPVDTTRGARSMPRNSNHRCLAKSQWEPSFPATCCLRVSRTQTVRGHFCSRYRVEDGHGCDARAHKAWIRHTYDSVAEL